MDLVDYSPDVGFRYLIGTARSLQPSFQPDWVGHISPQLRSPDFPRSLMFVDALHKELKAES